MPEPIIIETHSDDAILRLSDWLRGRKNVEALLRDKSSARIDILSAEIGELYEVSIGNCRVAYTPTIGDDAASIAKELADQLNAGGLGTTTTESFESDVFIDGEELNGQVGVQLVPWQSNFNLIGSGDPGVPFKITNEIARSGNQSIKTTLSEGVLPTTGGDPFTEKNIGSLIGYNGVSDAVNNGEFYFQLEDGFITAINDTGIAPWIGWTDTGAGAGIIFGLLFSSDGATYSLAVGLLGGALTFAGPFPSTELDDGTFHKFERVFNTDGSIATVTIDENPARDVSLVAFAGFVPLQSGLYSGANNTSLVTRLGLKDVFIDDFKVGESVPCGDLDLVNFIPTTTEDFENFADGVSVDGASYELTWSDVSPLGPSPEYLGGFLVTTVSPITGSKSARSNFGAGLDPGPVADMGIYHVAWAADYPGVDSPLQIFDFKIEFPIGFPGATFDATSGAEFWAPTILVVDFTTNVQYWALFTVSADDPLNIQLSITEDTATIGPGSILIPRSYLFDGNPHDIILSLNSQTLEGFIDIDEGTYRYERDLPQPIGTGSFFMFVASPVGGIPSTISGVPDFRFDDMHIGGHFSRNFCAKAVQKEAGVDPHFYAMRQACGVGNDLSIGIDVSQEDKISYTRIGPVDQLQELEDNLFRLLDQLGLDDAEGAQLDRLGVIVGLDRKTGGSDDDYRALIRVQIQSNLSKGEPERLIAIVKAFTSSSVVELREAFPGLVRIFFDGQVVNAAELLNAADDAAAAGVRLILIETPTPPVFAFDGKAGSGGFDIGKFSRTVTV